MKKIFRINREYCNIQGQDDVDLVDERNLEDNVETRTNYVIGFLNDDNVGLNANDDPINDIHLNHIHLKQVILIK